MKAVLVINMPSNCLECALALEEDYQDDWGMCMPMRKDFHDWDINDYAPHPKREDEEVRVDSHRASWCPLKQIPQKKKTGGSQSWMMEYRASGWNDCIDEILGEKENEYRE